jgi:60 kDa SS-A/Ro ribonucleoprotein
MRINRKPAAVAEFTHEGARAAKMTAEQALRRSVLSCMLWEDEFYEDGVAIAERISSLAAQINPTMLALLAIEARETMKLRHVPLLLLLTLVKTGRGTSLVSETITRVIQRADELNELLAMYFKMNPVPAGKKHPPIAAQLKLGIAKAFTKFDEYQLAKYDRKVTVKLRDAMALVRPNPGDSLAAVYKRMANRALQTPDTWEVSLSGGKDKQETWTRLLAERKLGYLALLRNLRNMDAAGVDAKLVSEAILARKGGAERVLPFRFVAAARACPRFEPDLNTALIASLKELPQFDGETILLVDVSASMDAKLSGRSDMSRMDAAATLAAIFPGKNRVFTFSNALREVPTRPGMSGVDAIINSQLHSGTDLQGALTKLKEKAKKARRLVVITDEQAFTSVTYPEWAEVAVMINVASNKNGVGYGRWIHIDGFSENVLAYLYQYEASLILS